ncbi:MAG: hypothetical protein ABSA78_19305 [Candidatus Sulfotelmatobacter sp.]
MDHQIQFARHNLDNHQALIRSSDAKAGVLVTVMVFVAASALQVSKDAVTKLQWMSCHGAIISALFLVSSVGLIAAVLWSLVAVQRVLRPRGARHYESAQVDRQLLWQDHVLMHGTPDKYFQALSAAPQELLLQNLTDQIFELAQISREKMDALRGARWAVWMAFWSWAVNIGAALALIRGT